MSKHINKFEGCTLRDLTLDDGFTFDTNDIMDGELVDDEFHYTNDVTLTNKEVINLLNVDNLDDNEDNGGTSTIHGLSFDELRVKMTDISGDGKVMKLIKQKGVGDVIPPDAQVTVKYIGYFEYRDEPFDSTFVRGGSETLRLGQGVLIEGLELAITSMCKHEIALFIIHPDLGYGKLGCLPRIPPNEHILFSVHLLDYVNNGPANTYDILTKEERKEFKNVQPRVEAKFNNAKEFFKKRRLRQAIREYMKGLNWLEEVQFANQEEEDMGMKLMSRGYNNVAVCYNMENMPRQACSALNRVVQATAKTHFNYGRALIRMGEYSQAMMKLQLALKMEPNNDQIKEEIKLLNEKQRKYKELEKKLWGNCLKIENTKKRDPTDFEKAMINMCEEFLKDENQLRFPFPPTLTPEEHKIACEVAASHGLSITTHERYDNVITYINKPKY